MFEITAERLLVIKCIEERSSLLIVEFESECLRPLSFQPLLDRKLLDHIEIVDGAVKEHQENIELVITVASA